MAGMTDRDITNSKVRRRPRGAVWVVLTVGIVSLLTACPGHSDQPNITSFTAAPGSIASGEESTLSWSVSGAVSLLLQPGDIDVTGRTSEVVQPLTTTTYVLTAKGTGGIAKRETTVTVVVKEFKAAVNPSIKPIDGELTSKDGAARRFGASRDESSVQSGFIVGEVLIHPKSPAELEAFLDRFGGTVIDDDSIPQSPFADGPVLSPDDLAPTTYLVRIDLEKVDVGRFEDDATGLGFGGSIEISDDDALRTLAAVTKALSEGFATGTNYSGTHYQESPTVLLNTAERPGFDAFNNHAFVDTGSESNVVGAWQFVAAHGIERRARVAIIDGGFWLDETGNPRTANGDSSDLPQQPAQYDFTRDSDRISGAPNTAPCGSGSCPWHGNSVAAVATGIANNNAAAIGTGGFVADPVLLNVDVSDFFQVQKALRTAVAWPVDIVNLSFGYACDLLCRQIENVGDKLGVYSVFTEIANAASKGILVVSAAGNDGKQVMDPNYYRFCVVKDVFCVGALAEGATTRATYSNFGERVDMFAPSGITVMPNGSSPSALSVFDGTSAAAPFVAGVAAMMKALNPDLTGNEIGEIMRVKAHKGSGEVTRYINALAAVREAAKGIDGNEDRLEPNDDIKNAHLIGALPVVLTDLGIHSQDDKDFFTFASSGRSILEIGLTSPKALGAVFLSDPVTNGSCPAIKLTEKIEDNVRSLKYAVSGGPQSFSVAANGVNAYNLSIDLKARNPLAADAYESNNTATTATRLAHRFPVIIAGTWYDAGIDPDVTIDANLHTSSDVDWYVVQGVSTGNLGGGGYFEFHPSVRVTDNESQVTLQVFPIAADGTPGPQLSSKTSATCDGRELKIRLEEGKSYLVRVSGAAGRYTLSNSYSMQFLKSEVPVIIRELNIDEIRHPEGPRPNEFPVRFPVAYGFIADRVYPTVDVAGAVQVDLYASNGELVSSTAESSDQRVALGALEHGAFYALAFKPLVPTEEGTPVTMTWMALPAQRVSANLLQNPGAESGPAGDGGGTVDHIDGWSPVPSYGTSTVTYYSSVGLGATDPGSDNRGSRLFVGGPFGLSVLNPSSGPSAMAQDVAVPSDWRAAVGAGNVKFSLGAFLGGFGDRHDGTRIVLAFRDGEGLELGRAALGPVTAYDRGGANGLWPMSTEGDVPVQTESITVTVIFDNASGETDYRVGLADDLELALSEYLPGR